METSKQAYMRHDEMANEALSEAQQLKALAPAGPDGREMREVASELKRRGNALRRAANSLLVVENRWIERAAGLFVSIDAQLLIWTGVDLSNNPVEFEGCDFSGVTFTECDLRGVKFTRCNLSGARFVRTNVAGLRLVDCNIDGLWFGNEDEFHARRYASPSNSAFCWNGGYIGSGCSGVLHRNCTGTAIGLGHLEDHDNNSNWK